jgi:hypothetical protein
MEAADMCVRGTNPVARHRDNLVWQSLYAPVARLLPDNLAGQSAHRQARIAGAFQLIFRPQPATVPIH